MEINNIKIFIKKGSEFAFQISHSGISTEKHLENKETTKQPRLFSSLTKSDIQDIINQFTNSAIVAKNAGADGVELNGAHGHLLSIFMSPYYNHRDDEYCCSVEGRARIVKEIVESVRNSCGPDFSILIKMNGNDFLQGGVDPELASKYVNFLKDRIDIFEISCGFSANAIMRPDTSKRKLAQHTYDLTFTEGYTLSFAQIIKRKNPDVIIASVGGFRQARMMEDAIKDKVIDIISLSRPLIREPNFYQKDKI